MLVQSTNPLRVAVLGSGVAGSTVARTLAERGVQVTVFEAGHGIGGRTSTRITRDESRYQFDHGAQYISTPKTALFQDALNRWNRDGWVKNWSGNFCTVGKLGIDMESEEKRKERYVGYPAMHSICRNLLHHDNIKVQLQTRANAVRQEGEDDNLGSKWELIHGKSKESLGNFDWLVATDRNSGTHFRKDLASGNVEEFRSGIRGIKSVKSLTAMVVFDKPLELGLDGIQFGDDERWGSLGWAARDTSKPGRDRKDGKECWVLQSHPDAAKKILKEIGTKKTDKIREKAEEVLVRDFLASAAILAGDTNVEYSSPSVETSIGHRWGAAFPVPSQEYVDMDCQLIAGKQFVACGDYFGSLSGRIEGAYLSGLSAANKLCEEEELNE
jgi:predicted NAD/FAD-dependent oxidoreductase